MKSAGWFISGICVFCLVAFFTNGYGQTGPGIGGAGRFAFYVDAVLSGGDTVFVLDTTTGECWTRDTGDKVWQELGSPVIKRTK